MPQVVKNAYKLFDDFTSPIKSLALPKSWKVEVKEQLVIVSLMSSEYLLSFTGRVRLWVLSDKHELIQSYNASFNNAVLSKFIESLSSY